MSIEGQQDQVVVQAPTSKPEVSYEDFAKLDIRVGTITAAEAVPKSKKLLKLKIHFGPEIGDRTVVAGIAGSYAEVSSVIGLQATAIVNLAPRTMFGIESHGMILAGKWTDGRINLVACNGVPDGGEIG